MTDLIRILIVDDQTTIRQALMVLLGQEQDFQIVGDANNGETGLKLVAELQPDIALVDIQMPGIDGIETTKRICQHFSDTKVLVLSGQDSGNYLKEAFRVGAKGYLLKNTPAEDLANAIRSVHKGYGQVSPGLLEKVVTHMGVLQEQPAIPSVPVSNGELSGSSAFQSTQKIMPDVDLLLLLRNFDSKTLLEAVGRIHHSGQVSAVMPDLKAYLVNEPTNLSALYLYGTLLYRSQKNQSSALQYLRLGFNEGIKQGLSRENLLLFYKETSLFAAENAFEWLLQTDSFRNHEAGFILLCQEAKQQFGAASPQFQTCLNLHRIRVLRRLGDRCLALRPNLNLLQRGFARLNGVLTQ
jgi:DNA-binding NarL/FixJ family response regulator